jgi:hypothetical protein
MLGAVKNENFAIYTQSGNDIWILRLVSSLVHLSRVLDLLDNITFDGSYSPGAAVAPNLASLLIVVGRVWCDRFGNLDIGDL